MVPDDIEQEMEGEQFGESDCGSVAVVELGQCLQIDFCFIYYFALGVVFNGSDFLEDEGEGTLEGC